VCENDGIENKAGNGRVGLRRARICLAGFTPSTKSADTPQVA